MAGDSSIIKVVPSIRDSPPRQFNRKTLLTLRESQTNRDLSNPQDFSLRMMTPWMPMQTVMMMEISLADLHLLSFKSKEKTGAIDCIIRPMSQEVQLFLKFLRKNSEQEHATTTS